MKYICRHCGWMYDECKGLTEADIEPETQWEEVPEDFEPPLCWAGKEAFSALME